MSGNENPTLAALNTLCEAHNISPAATAALSALISSASGEDFETLPPEDDTFADLAQPPEALLSDRGQETDSGEVSVEPGMLSLSAADMSRYEDLGLLGVGGMGEVRRVRDTVLQRRMAMKLLHPRLRLATRSVARFVEEAQVSAQLAHPGVVPVYDLGQTPDGRWFFTMQEVRGGTLSDSIQALHSDAPSVRFRRLLDVFLRVCETVAYAHARGVIHRDLKPNNIMVGSFGRVLVLDWGLARVMEGAWVASGDEAEDAIQTARLGQSALATLAGAVSGTPAYMAPEQAFGRLGEIGPLTDVYALGAILYEILCGRPPYIGLSARAVLEAVRAGPPQPPSGQRPIPPELSALAMACMSRSPADRPAGAEAVVSAVAGWLDGAARRERALAFVDEARALQPELERHARAADALRAQAQHKLQGLPRHAPIEDKLPAWALVSQAEEADQAALRAESDWLQRLHAALNTEPSLPEARDLLADYYHRRHCRAEATQDVKAVRDAEVMLRVHDRGRYAAYLRGDGALTLQTDPPGAAATLFRFVSVQRRLEPRRVRELGKTPLVDVTLPMGSYLIRLTHPDRAPLDLPVSIGRQQRWDNVRPGQPGATPVRLLPQGALGPDDCYVPAGDFWVGDREVDSAPPRGLVWVDSFVIERHPVTIRRYLGFLNALSGDVSALVPGGEQGSFQRGEDGRWACGPDEQGQVWELDWPVIRVSWLQAQAFAAWQSERDGLPWRLPTQWEWEKAARGVDGRIFPWGDHFDANWGRFKYSLPGRTALAQVSDTPLDVGPYGVNGMAGNVSDWCADGPAERRERSDPAPRIAPAAADSAGAVRWMRGGTCGYPQQYCRLALRFTHQPQLHRATLGFRLARSLD